jgi:hypothetical protein
MGYDRDGVSWHIARQAPMAGSKAALSGGRSSYFCPIHIRSLRSSKSDRLFASK